MAKIPKIGSMKDAEKYLELCSQGKLRVQVDVIQGKREYTITNNSGVHQAIIGEKVKYIFEQYVGLNGNGDGLFEGFSQTAGGRT